MGALLWRATTSHLEEANRILKYIGNASFARGRDGYGFHVNENLGPNFGYKNTNRSIALKRNEQFFSKGVTRSAATMIANFRAEPTTEFVVKKTSNDQQPYSLGGWHIVHNGTIANDKDCGTNVYPTTIDSAAIVEQLNRGNVTNELSAKSLFHMMVSRIKGSYAILATHWSFPIWC